jgi:hypothetical protein
MFWETGSTELARQLPRYRRSRPNSINPIWLSRQLSCCVAVQRESGRGALARGGGSGYTASARQGARCKSVTEAQKFVNERGF